MQVSVLVVMFNEERRLKDCLLSLRQFDDVTVVDLGSKDHSVKIAKDLGFNVISHPWVAISEMVLPEIVSMMKYDWIIRADPDEVYPAELLHQILTCIDDNPQAAIVKIPFQYYFFGKPLATSVWGGIRYFSKVLNRQHVILHDKVHTEPELQDGYKIVQIPYDGEHAVKHYWIDSLSQLFEKHQRYLRLEGPALYDHGERFSWAQLAKSLIRTLANNLVKYKGWRGGLSGIFLSFFHTWYVGMSWLSLRRYQKQRSIDTRLHTDK